VIECVSESESQGILIWLDSLVERRLIHYGNTRILVFVILYAVLEDNGPGRNPELRITCDKSKW
jgi:hypothetical protein